MKIISKKNILTVCLALITSSNVFSYQLDLSLHDTFFSQSPKIRPMSAQNRGLFFPEKVTCFNVASYLNKNKIDASLVFNPTKDPVDWPSMIRECLDTDDFIGDWAGGSESFSYLVHLSLTANGTLFIKIYERDLTQDNSNYELTQSGLLFEKNAYFEGFVFKNKTNSYKKVILYRFGNNLKLRSYSKHNDEIDLLKLF